MAALVGGEEGQSEGITFLYKLCPGACPRSYGLQVSRAPWLPKVKLHAYSVWSVHSGNTRLIAKWCLHFLMVVSWHEGQEAALSCHLLPYKSVLRKLA